MVANIKYLGPPAWLCGLTLAAIASRLAQMSSTAPTHHTQRAYGGYYNQPQKDSDTLLTRVGPGTPCGEYLRRYWHPFLIASEIGDTPIKVRLLGEDLVAFRDKSGRIGLLHRHCVHRGVSLEFGIPQERGIRCCYHGWQFDIDGTILDTPAEPPTSRIKDNFCQGAYPVREFHGLLFAYLGPPEQLPAFPLYDTFLHPSDNVHAPLRMNVPCNWLQIVENACDPIHNAFLHAIVSGEQFSPAFKVPPTLDFVETPLGFLSMATRKVGDYAFIRAGDIIFPNVAQFTSGNNTVAAEEFRAYPSLTRWAVPVDDENSFYIGFTHINAHSNPRSMRAEDYGVDKMPLIGQTAERPYEERQREPGDYDAMTGPGPIANRKAEHLGTTDRGVVMFRRLLTQHIQAITSEQTPLLPRLYPENETVQTYAHESVTHLPSAERLRNPAAIAEFGRNAALAFVATDHLPREQRGDVARKKIAELLQATPKASAAE
jgi:nitrite reductase/ring-hydroxylating ferredoxin subunit